MSNDKDAFNVSDLTTALIQENRADLVNALKNKIQSLAGQHSDVLESLTPSVRKRVEVLREIQGQHDELEAKFFEERAALEAKYQKMYQPLYTKNSNIMVLNFIAMMDVQYIFISGSNATLLVATSYDQ
ncbi:hypothetical protein Ahy_A01g001634 isoform G [Arachis hypogaea]|uniref:Nucleosome assembly protein n=1 Tax=Arachis hypogaea TaxID=3818 RepID=A0A445ENZ3_ARAHY|nr:hypothetical protein Ahy_A01g001634 isoform G [Arachis hypogaea]